MKRKLTAFALAAVAGGSALAAHALAAGDDASGSRPGVVSEPAAPAAGVPFEEIRVPAVGGGTTVIEVEESVRRWADVATLREVAASGRVSVFVGSGSAPSDSCLIVRTAPGRQVFGCSAAGEIARQGVYLASREVGGGLVGAFLIPEGATSASINGTPVSAGASGVVPFDMGDDRGPVTLGATGNHGTVTYRVQ